MESKNNNNIIVTVLLVIIIIGLLGFILYDKVLKKDIDTNNTTSNVEENNNQEEIQKEISVVDAVNYSYTQSYNNSKATFTTKLPKIIGTTDVINNLNNKILNDIIPETYFLPICGMQIVDDEGNSACLQNGASIEYSYKIENEILVIYIYLTAPGGVNIPGSGKGVEASYQYDIKNDKVLTVKEAAQKLNIDFDFSDPAISNKTDNEFLIRILDNQFEVVGIM